MCHDNMEVSTGERERITFVLSPDFPPREGYSHYVNADRRFGALHHIAFRGNGVNVWMIKYRLTKDTTLHLRFPALSTLSLYFALGNDMPYEINGIPPGIAKRGCFNIIYQQGIDDTFHLEKDKEYILTGISFTKEYLQSPNVPEIVVEILKEMDTGKTLLLAAPSDQLRIEDKTMPSIDLLSHLLLTGTIKWNYQTNMLISKLTRQSFKKADSLDTKQRDEAILFEKMVSFIEKNLKVIDVDKLVNEFHFANKVRLRKVFQKYADTNTRDFITERQLIHGKYLIENTDTMISNIGVEVGYSSPPAFSAAILARFKMYPLELRTAALNSRKGKDHPIDPV